MNPNLTNREKEIYDLAVNTCLSSRLMSERLCVTNDTIKTHLMNIYSKLQVKNRIELVIKHWTNKETL